MIHLCLLVVDVWDDGSQNDNSWAIEDADSVRKAMDRVKTKEWRSLISSRVWLVEGEPGQPEDRVLIWEWVREG